MTVQTPADTPEVILGSASPARLSVLRAAGLSPRVLVSDVDEEALIADLGPAAAPEEVVARLAEAKAHAIVSTVSAESPAVNALVLTCDSMLLFEGELTGKPHTREVAAAQWARMRGRSAQLLTGHCVTRLSPASPPHGDLSPAVSAPAISACETSSTTIRFADASDEEIAAYVATDEPLAVAGAFTLDALGGWFIDGIDGNPSAVLGIGLPTVRRLLADLDVRVADLWQV